MNILLDYFFPITQIPPLPPANTAFLKQVLVVALKNATGVDGVITECENMTQVGLVTDNLEAQQLFNAGMKKVFVLVNPNLTLAAILNAADQDFFTILISSDYADAAVTAMTLGNFTGVVGVSSTDATFLGVQALILRRSAFFTNVTNDAKNMMFAFGKLLSNRTNWLNQQYITMPFNDGVSTLAQANNLFDAKISFVLNDTQFGNRLGLFAAGQKAITAPYIVRNLEIEMQASALAYIVANQPAYTITQASLIQDELEKVIAKYILRQLIEAGTINITLVEANFVANGDINISEPNALWRIFATLKQTL